MSRRGFNRESYTRPNGLRGDTRRSPGTGTGKGLGKGFSHRDLEAQRLRDREARALAHARADAIARQGVEDRVRPKIEETSAAVAAWAGVCRDVRSSVPESTFRLWLEPLVLLGEAESALCVTARAGVFAWVIRRYAHLLGEAVRARTGFRGVFVFLDDADPETGDGCH